MASKKITLKQLKRLVENVMMELNNENLPEWEEGENGDMRILTPEGWQDFEFVEEDVIDIDDRNIYTTYINNVTYHSADGKYKAVFRMHNSKKGFHFVDIIEFVEI